MEQLTIMTPKGAALKMDDTYPDETTAREDLMRRYRIAIDRLAAYEDTGLMPEEITTRRPACVFYCNRQCNLNGDFCAEGPGCPMELDQGGAERLLALRQEPHNAPLTLEELREMDGEPVWLVTSTDGAQWAFVIIDHEEFISFNCADGTEWEFDLYSDNDGVTWTAYRRKLEVTNDA